MKIKLNENIIRRIIRESIEDILWGENKPRGYRTPIIPEPKRRFNSMTQRRDPNDDIFDGTPHSYTVNIWDNSVNTEREFSDTFDNIRSSRELDDAVRAKYPTLNHWNTPRRFKGNYIPKDWW